MTLPDRITGRWIATLSDAELQEAERELHAAFAERETVEKGRRGSDYDLMRGTEPLTAAWMRWSMVRNASLLRGVPLRRIS